MQILQIDAPTNCGTLFTGRAVSTRGRQYMFFANRRGRMVQSMTYGGRSSAGADVWLLRTATPPALAGAVRKAVGRYALK